VPGRSGWLLDWNPDFDDSVSGPGIEILAVCFELGRLDGCVSRCRQPLYHDVIPGICDFRDVTAVGEDGVSLFFNPQQAQPRWRFRIGHYFDAAQVIHISRVVEVEADSIARPPHLPRNLADVRSEALPLLRDALDCGHLVALDQSRDLKCLSVFKSRRFQTGSDFLHAVYLLLVRY